MSAYIVEKKTIDRVVSYIHEKPLYIIQRYYPAIYKAYKGDPNKLGKALWAMNVEAVNQRYQENNSVELYHYEYYPANLIQIYKSLSCYLYQCNEGNIPKTHLYKELSALLNNIAREIITNLPEYENAEWA